MGASKVPPTRTPSNGACLTGHQPLPSTQQALSSLLHSIPVSRSQATASGSRSRSPCSEMEEQRGELVPVLISIILSAG